MSYSFYCYCFETVLSSSVLKKNIPRQCSLMYTYSLVFFFISNTTIFNMEFSMNVVEITERLNSDYEFVLQYVTEWHYKSLFCLILL